MQGRGLKGREHESFFEIDDVLLVACASRGRRELAALQFPALLLARVQNGNFALGPNPVFVSRTEFPIGLRPAKFGPTGKNSGVLSNIPRSPYHVVSPSQLQSPHRSSGCIFPWMGKKYLRKYDAPVLRTLHYSPHTVCLFKRSTGWNALSASQKAEGGCVPGICAASWLCW